MHALGVGLFAAVATLLLTPLVRSLAIAFGAVANPRADRWHARPTALGGGIAIGIAPLLLLTLDREWQGNVGVLLAGGALMFGLGLADDVWRIRPSLKFTIQVGAALLFPLTGAGLDWTGIALIDAALTVVWIVGITNAVNFIDNMDGLAAGIVALVAAALSVVFLLHQQPAPARAAAAIAGSVAAFLVFNFKPASIFMGDTGSMFLGFTIAGLATFVGKGRPGHFLASLDVLSLLLLVPIFDTAYVTVRRRLEHRPFWEGGRDHTSHGLVALGCSERQAVLCLYGLCAWAAGTAVVAAAGHRIPGLVMMIPLALGLGALGLRLARLPRIERVTLATPHPGALPARPVHAFTVDVEDWFQGIPIAATQREGLTPRLDVGLDRLLGLLDGAGVRATFFILGPIARDRPELVRRIADAGHEIGCHGWSHDLVYSMSPERFRDETRRAVDAISAATGAPVRAYRAAYFSITNDSLWALAILAELGFHTDSSIMPVRTWRYGIPGYRPDPHRIDTPAGAITEVPISVRRILGRNIPVAGGAYFRLYPYSLTRANLHAMETAGRAGVFYIHPWELDPAHPRIRFQWRSRVTHYANLKSTEPRLRRLLQDFRFAPLGEVVGSSLDP